MAYFRKRGEKWYYTLTWTDDKGKYHKSERIGGLTKADCQKAWREAMKQIDTTGVYFSPSDKPFSDCLDEWLRSIHKDYKQNTLDSFEAVVRNHLNPDLGNYKLKKLTTAKLQSWLDGKRDVYSKSTVKTFYAILKNFFRWVLLNRQYLQHNPMDNVSIPRYFTLPKKTHVFTPDEIQAIFRRFAPPHSFYMPIMLAYCCGMRLGECLALTWDNVDFENHIIKHEEKKHKKRLL